MSFTFRPFSPKQKQAIWWWRPGSPSASARIFLADGAIRSGKTVAMLLSFLLWSQSSFTDQHFILAGVTGGAFRRNVLTPMFAILESLGIPYSWKRTESSIRIGSNTYHIFGADKENAQDKLQGMTAAGAYADEVALFPRSFTDQMIGRCSVEGSKIFMNCNPAGAYHYIKTRFIDRADEIGLFHLHFTMDDNLTLSPEIRKSYEKSFSGVFYRQYILGEWVSAEGLIYPMWEDEKNTFTGAFDQESCSRCVAVDYGTTNPMVFLDCRDDGHTFRITNEYYWDSAARQRQKTDAEYADDLVRFLDGDLDAEIILDPSAASFRAELRNRGFRVKNAVNAVREGIATTAVLIGNRQILVDRENTPNLQREIHAYVWDEKARLHGEEKPLKERDHAMDALRYLVSTKSDRFRRVVDNC